MPVLRVDKTHPKPAFLQLRDELEAAIRRGDFPPGTTLPSERELSERVGLSRMTVRRALEELVAARLVEQRRGSGTYVLSRRVDQPADVLLSYTQEASLLGFRPGSVLFEAKVVRADEEVARGLRLRPGDEVLRVTRLRTADDEPLALQTSHLPPPYHTLSIDSLRRDASLYQVLREQFGVTPAGAEQSISARLPTPQECEMLAIDPATPVLALERTAFDDRGAPFEYVLSAYRSDRYRVLLRLQA
jgi:GntR family transcriptional regulator